MEGPIVLLPTLIVFALAIVTQRPIESLLAGAIAGLLMLHGTAFVPGLAETAVRVLTDEDVAWVILVCGLMGSLMGLLIRSGATRAFTQAVTARVRTRRGALFATWGMGLSMFVDDYLNSIAVGSSMRRITDRFRVSREKLAYVVDSTAAPVSVIIPFSTWGVFFAGLIVDNGIAPEGEGLNYYISAIPYMFYAWIAVLLVPVVIAGGVPMIGPMRAAERRARETGQMVPPGAEHIDEANRSIEAREDLAPSSALFVLPMVLLVAATLWFDQDFLVGIIVTLGVLIGWLLLRRTLGMNETFNTALDGFKVMIEPLAVLVAAFMLKDVNDALGLAPWVVAALQPLLTPETLPAVVFVSMALVSFLTGSNWGVFVIVLPIVAALTNSLGADMVLVIGATLSASTFGSHACFYSDATVLTAQASGCTPFQHAWTQIPYALIAAAVALVAYLLLGLT